MEKRISIISFSHLIPLLVIFLFPFISSDELSEIEKIKAKYSHTSEEFNLYFVYAMFRHGAREPMKRNIGKNNKDILGTTWEKPEELTKKGISYHYLLGKTNRERYLNFIKKDYDPKETVIYSTTFNRTIMSAQSQLLGFYNSINFTGITNKEILIDENKVNKINAILPPINLIEKKEPKLGKFLFDKQNRYYEDTLHYSWYCPSMRKLVKKSMKEGNPVLTSLTGNFNVKYGNKLKRQLGENFTFIPQNLSDFCDILVSTYFDDNKSKKLNESFISSNINFEEIVSDCFSVQKNDMFELFGGGLASNNSLISMSIPFRQILYWMGKRINVSQTFISYNAPKYILFSGHDITVALMEQILQKAFGVDLEFPIFGFNLLFELRKYKDDKFYVEIYYNDILKLNITFDEFAKKIMNSTIEEEKVVEYCYEINKYSLSNISFIFLVIFACLITFLISLMRYYCPLKRAYKKLQNISPIHSNMKINVDENTKNNQKK